MMDDRKFQQVGDRRFASFPDETGALWLIQQFGIFGLGGSDGCYCCNFEVRGIEVHVSCHKSEHCVRVVCGSMDSRKSALFEIAREVLSQLPQNGYRVRFCDYACDHVNGRWEGGIWHVEHKCCYCGKPRADPEAYLCEKCATNPSARHWDDLAFELPPADDAVDPALSSETQKGDE